MLPRLGPASVAVISWKPSVGARGTFAGLPSGWTSSADVNKGGHVFVRSSLTKLICEISWESECFTTKTLHPSDPGTSDHLSKEESSSTSTPDWCSPSSPLVPSAWQTGRAAARAAGEIEAAPPLPTPPAAARRPGPPWRTWRDRAPTPSLETGRR